MFRNIVNGARATANRWTSGPETVTHTILSTATTPTVQQVRYKWANWLMIKDVKRRRLNAENFVDRLRLIALAKNRVLPLELREEAAQKVHAFPLDSTPLRINKRCAITSRPRGIVYDFRLSRMVFRHHADYNKLSGIQRAMWGYTQI